jgi:integrase/recombinase XerD
MQELPRSCWLWGLTNMSGIRSNAPTTGAHQFRHGLATEMLRHGVSPSEIGELLGHRSSEATKIYIKIDITALRTLALPWPGGVR